MRECPTSADLAISLRCATELMPDSSRERSSEPVGCIVDLACSGFRLQATTGRRLDSTRLKLAHPLKSTQKPNKFFVHRRASFEFAANFPFRRLDHTRPLVGVAQLCWLHSNTLEIGARGGGDAFLLFSSLLSTRLDSTRLVSSPKAWLGWARLAPSDDNCENRGNKCNRTVD